MSSSILLVIAEMSAIAFFVLGGVCFVFMDAPLTGLYNVLLALWMGQVALSVRLTELKDLLEDD